MPNASSEVVECLHRGVAATVVTQMKAQNFHWNVTGMSFGSLHELFEDIYKDHFKAADKLAERLRAIGAPVDGRFATFLAQSDIQEREASIPAREMIDALAGDERRLSAALKELAEVAERNDDAVTNDLALERAAAHDKFAWMLAAHLEDQ
jgi:starvation-inducible DNA-binding protein